MAGASNPGVVPTVRQTIVETLEAPRLCGIRTEDIVQFKEKRLVYERKVAAKSTEGEVNVQLTSYRDSIDESVLDLFVLSAGVLADTVSGITEDQLKSVVEERSKVPEDQFDLGKIERAIKGINMGKPSKGSGLESQVWQFVLK